MHDFQTRLPVHLALIQLAGLCPHLLELPVVLPPVGGVSSQIFDCGGIPNQMDSLRGEFR